MRVLHQDAGDHKGPLHLHSAALAPTAQTTSHLHSRLRLMPIWSPRLPPCTKISKASVSVNCRSSLPLLSYQPGFTLEATCAAGAIISNTSVIINNGRFNILVIAASCVGASNTRK